MRYSLLAGLLAVAGVNCSSNYYIESETVEDLGRVPEGWSEVGAPAQDHKIRFRIAIRSVSLRFLRLLDML
jgi:tripeptidyl-peptidase-1